MAKCCQRDWLWQKVVIEVGYGKKLSQRLFDKKKSQSIQDFLWEKVVIEAVYGKKLVVCVVFSKKFVYGNELSKSFHRGCL